MNTTALHASLHAFCSHVRDLPASFSKQAGFEDTCKEGDGCIHVILKGKGVWGMLFSTPPKTQ